MHRRLAVAAITLFVVVDVVLVIAAFRHVHTPDDHTATPVSESDGESNDADAGSEVDPDEYTNLAVHDSRVAKYAAGKCSKPDKAALKVSDDDGESFEEYALPLQESSDDSGDHPSELTSILSVDASQSDTLDIIGTDTDCDVHKYRTENKGTDWNKRDWNKADASGWFVADNTVHAPSGSVDPECDAASVWPLNDRQAKVFCSDGVIVGTETGGEQWVRLGTLDDFTAGSFSGLRDGIAAGTKDDCAARAYTTDNAGGRWQEAGCIDADDEATSLVSTGDDAYALAGGTLQYSDDNGKTWDEP